MMLSEAGGAFFDPAALVVVLAGTALATAARCGLAEIRAAMRAFAGLFAAALDEDLNRAALARCASAIGERGHLCAECPPPPDPATARLVESYIVSGSIEALHRNARAERARREIARAQGVRVFEFAGELAPVFGLVGTLVAITQLAPATGTSAAQMTMAAVATAVLSSLYGVLTAHLFCIPLARAIERRGEREERVRADLLARFETMLSGEEAHFRERRKSLRDAA